MGNPFVAARALRLVAALAFTAPALTLAAEQPYRVTAGALNVRSGPGTSYAIVGSVKLDQQYVADAVSNNWYRIWYRGNQGWCSGSYLAAVSGATAVRVTAGALNVRSGPGTQYSIVGQALQNHEHVRIASSASWSRIWWGGGAYWVSSAYVTLVTTFTPPGSTPAPVPAPATASLYGMNIDPANPAGNPTPEQLKAAGARWVRVEWKIVPGASLYDTALPRYRAAGLRVLLILDYSTVLGKPSVTAPDSEWTAYVANFVAGARNLAARYRDGVDAWQIWNEPDLPDSDGYRPAVPPAHYGRMLRDARAAIRTYSTRPVVTAGLASGNAAWLSSAISAAGTLAADAVCIHPYGQRAPDNWPWADWGFGNMSDVFNRYIAFGKPVWVTEIGVPVTDQNFQADYLQNVYTLVKSRYAGKVTEVFWFCWSDGMVPPYGVNESNGAPKAAYWRYRSIAGAW